MINCIILSCSLVFICIYTIEKITRTYKDTRYTYKDKLDIFDYFVSKAYDTVYETDLITNITNNVKLSTEERETIERNFVKRCMVYMGRKNLKMFIDFFGDESTLFVNIIRYMRKRINEDGLSKIIDEQTNNQNI